MHFPHQPHDERHRQRAHHPLQAANLNRSLTAQLDLINEIDSQDIDFVFIQEPHIDFLNQTRANQHCSHLPHPAQHLPRTHKINHPSQQVSLEEQLETNPRRPMSQLLS